MVEETTTSTVRIISESEKVAIEEGRGSGHRIRFLNTETDALTPWYQDHLDYSMHYIVIQNGFGVDMLPIFESQEVVLCVKVEPKDVYSLMSFSAKIDENNRTLTVSYLAEPDKSEKTIVRSF